MAISEGLPGEEAGRHIDDMRDAISARMHEIFDPKPERPRLSTSSPIEAPATAPVTAPAPTAVPTPAPTPSPAAPTTTGSPSVRTLEPSGKPYTGPRPSWLDKPNVPDISQEPTPLPAHLTGQAPSATPPPAATTTTKPVGRPVTSATTSPPPPAGAGAQQVSAQVTQTGNATPKPVAKVTATVQNTPPPPAKVVTSGAPTPRPLLRKTGDDISKALLGGTKGTRNIKLAGAAALLGVGAFAVSRNARPSSDDYERKLEMQRRGMMM